MYDCGYDISLVITSYYYWLIYMRYALAASKTQSACMHMHIASCSSMGLQ